jgi:hypothetical protein
LVIQVNESPKAPHAIESTTQVYIRPVDSANPTKLADIQWLERQIPRRRDVLQRWDAFFSESQLLAGVYCSLRWEMLNARIARLEREKRFRDWLTFERFLEGLTDQQLELYALHGQLPEPLPEPLPLGASRLYGMDRKNLIRMWEAHEREFGDRTKEELNFYSAHGHWPGQLCDERCRKKVESRATTGE